MITIVYKEKNLGEEYIAYQEAQKFICHNKSSKSYILLS